MLIHAAYLRNSKSPIVDQSTPPLVTSCGNYRLKNCEKIVTHRPNGRKDYQLLYIAAGKAHFYFNGTEKIVSAGNMVLYFPDQPQEYIIKKRKPMFTGFILQEVTLIPYWSVITSTLPIPFILWEHYQIIRGFLNRSYRNYSFVNWGMKI